MLDFPGPPLINGQTFSASNGVLYTYLLPPGVWSSTPAPSGLAGGDLVGAYPNPTIKSGVVLTGDPTRAEMPPAGDSDSSIPTTAWVQGEIGTALTGTAGGDLAGSYPNPTIKPGVDLTGVPIARTAGSGTNTEQLATTQFVNTAVAGAIGGAIPSGPAGGDLAGTYPDPTLKTNLILTGNPTLATPPAAGDNDSSIPTTAWVQNELLLKTAAIVDSVAALKALTTRPLIVHTLGYAAPNDTGTSGPLWHWTPAGQPNSTATADDFMVVNPTSGPPGRYLRKMQAGASVSPRWAGCGLGLPDPPESPTPGVVGNDTFRMKRVLAVGRAVDASGATYRVKEILIDQTMVCPGIYSDGTGTFMPTTDIVYPQNMFYVTKEFFYFRRLRFICPITTNPNPPGDVPAMSRPIYFYANTGGVDIFAYARDWEVSDCYIEGGDNAITFQGGCETGRIQRNHITGQWRDAISGPNWYHSCFITDNHIHDGGYAAPALSGSGCIRTGTGNNTHDSYQLQISRNHISRWYNHPDANGAIPNQSMIDCFSGTATLVDICDNVIENSGGSIEFKTIWAPAGPNIYKGFNISNNTIRHTGDGLSGAGITCFLTSNYPTTDDRVQQPKAGHLKIEGNHFYGESRQVRRGGGDGIYVGGYDDVSVLNNTITNTDSGIRIDGPVLGAVAPSFTTPATDIVVSGNNVKCVGTALYFVGSIGIDRLYVVGNTVRTETYAMSMSSGGPISNFVVKNNYMQSLWGTVFGMSDCHGGIISDNTIIGGSTGLTVASSPVSDNLMIERNRIRSYQDPLHHALYTVTCTNPGTGLTNGVRTFTVTSGTGVRPIIFQYTVAATSITGSPTLLEMGDYTVFPTNPPTVTVDTGIVGGAVFQLTEWATTQPVIVGAGATNVFVQNNSIEGPVDRESIGSSTAVTANNLRGVRATTPQGTYAGTRGDVFYNTNVAAAGTIGWICTTTGTIAGAVWKTYGTISA